MQEYNTIESPKLQSVLQEVAEEQTLMRVHITGHDYERLTLITDMRNDAGVDLFCIDMPDGLPEALKKKPTTRLHFEFTGKDRLPYKFESEIKQVSAREVLLSFPDVIFRYQARNDFRIRTPGKTEIITDMEGTTIRLSVQNISLGGAFCHCRNHHKTVVETCQEIVNAALLFTLNDECVEVKIKKIELRRIEPLHRPKHFGVAYEFTEMKADTKRQLTQLIYELQREFLQNRLKTD